MSDETEKSALDYHRFPKPGKIEISATKPLANQRDLALAYSPGVAEPCKAIVTESRMVAELTARSNLVAVVTNVNGLIAIRYNIRRCVQLLLNICVYIYISIYISILYYIFFLHRLLIHACTYIYIQDIDIKICILLFIFTTTNNTH